MPARGFAGNHAAGIDQQAQSQVRNTPTKEGILPSHSGPNTSDDLLEFYFGNPTSTHKSSGVPHRSKW